MTKRKQKGMMAPSYHEPDLMPYPKPYLYQTSGPVSGSRAVVVLPEIFGANAHICDVADRFAREFNVPAFFNDARSTYHEAAAKAAWEHVQSLFPRHV